MALEMGADPTLVGEYLVYSRRPLCSASPGWYWPLEGGAKVNSPRVVCVLWPQCGTNRDQNRSGRKRITSPVRAGFPFI
jgi:hypothetical protein